VDWVQARLEASGRLPTGRTESEQATKSPELDEIRPTG
jgi:hypothetical protein